jgi:hypothetical protein
MITTTSRLLYWTPRILGILFAAFTSIYALDVFDEALGFWQTLAALGVHLIPTAAIVGLLLLAWRWEWIGSVAFLALAILYVFWGWGRFPLSVYVVMCTPLIVMSVPFYLNWKNRRTLHMKHAVT